MNATKGIGPEKMTFMAEGKPGHPDAYHERMLQNAQLRNEQLRKEIVDMRKEIFDLEKSNEELAEKLSEIVDEFAEATIQVIELRRHNVDLSSQKSNLVEVVADLRERLEGSDSVLLRREILNLRKSNDTLKKRIRSCHE